MSRRPLTTLVLALVAAVVAAVVGVLAPVAAHASAPVPVPPAGHGASQIEGRADYVGQTACDPHVRSGTRALAQLLARTYKNYGATSWASAYACGTDGGQSEHYEGRAIDWMVDIHDKGQHAAALAFLHWLLATDRSGNQYAMARRLGVMYVIYDNRMWGGWSGRWEDYNGCARLTSRANDNACHRTHMHISLSWNGAMGRTSYWTGHVAATDYGPCRPADLNWADRYRRANPNPCPLYRTVQAAKGASATKRALVQYSGADVGPGSGGPAVSAVQRGLHVSATGSWTGATTTAVRAFQLRHHVSRTGTMTPATWRVLLGLTK